MRPPRAAPRRVCLALVSAASPAFGQGSPPAAGGRPNVLLIIADDLNRSLPCYGHVAYGNPPFRVEV